MKHLKFPHRKTLQFLDAAKPPEHKANQSSEPSLEWYLFTLFRLVYEAMNDMKTECELPIKLEHSNSDTVLELCNVTIDCDLDATYSGTREVLTVSWGKK
jgi:hypothetical protein